MIDRGWRRSGHYIYRPDCGYTGTCCPQIAIRVLVDQYRPRSDQKRAIASLQRLVREPTEANVKAGMTSIKAAHKGKYSARWDIEQQWKLIEWSEPDQYDFSENPHVDGVSQMQLRREGLRPVHKLRADIALAERRSGSKASGHSILPPLMGPKRRKFETTLRLAESTPEKYALFRSYQMKVHGESETKVSDEKGFERFLCKGPLMPFTPGAKQGQGSRVGDAIDLVSSSPIAYDQYHMEYRYEGRLVAVGVLDILPRSVSSVYLFYDPAYSHLYLGKVSAIREMLLVKQLQRKTGMQDIKHYNLGLYVHSCRKMRYKAEYHPAEVLDPSICEWLQYTQVKAQLDQGVRYDFLHRHSDVEIPKLVVVNRSEERSSSAMDLDKQAEDEDEDHSMPIPPPPGILNPTTLPNEMIALSLVFDNGRVNLLMVSPDVPCAVVDVFLMHIFF